MEMPAEPPPRSAEEEEAFADLVRRRDPAAFEAFVRETCGLMLAVARRFLPCEEDAYDAVQDAFLSAFRSVDRFEGQAKLSTWLHRIVVNACLMKLRGRKRQSEASIEAWLPHFVDGEHRDGDLAPWAKSAAPDGAAGAEREETRELVRAAIQKLPEAYRTVLLLRDIEGLDTAETAALLGTSEGVVKTRLHRARQALRGILDPHMKEGRP